MIQERAIRDEGEIKVWDIAVRIFHWSLVALFFVAYLSGDEDSLLHAYAGYGVCGLVAFRIVWGLVGTRHARFSDFVRGRAVALDYARSVILLRPPHYLGHNPLGGWMVVALLVSLIGACWSGLAAYGDEGHGPLAGEEIWFVSAAMAHDEARSRSGEDGRSKGDGEGHGFWGEVHESLSNLTLFLVFLHVGGVVVTSVLDRENLAKAMITGFKRRRAP